MLVVELLFFDRAGIFRNICIGNCAQHPILVESEQPTLQLHIVCFFQATIDVVVARWLQYGLAYFCQILGNVDPGWLLHKA